MCACLARIAGTPSRRGARADQPAAGPAVTASPSPGVSGTPSASSTAGASPAGADASAPQPVAAVLGDSFLTTGSTSWAALVGKELGWTVITVPLGASGFVQAGPDGTLEAGIPDVVAAEPDVVVVAGGYADADEYPAADVGAAARALLERLRCELPDAQLVLTGPFSTTDVPTWGQPRTRDALAAAASAVRRAAFVDPLP